MATNQILHAVDEIINGTPKYNITNNADGTKGIELANEVVQEGMALNKACIDKIDNVLSYLTPSVEKVISGTSDVAVTGTFMPTTWTQVTQWTKYSSDYTLQDGTTGKVYISTNDTQSPSTSTYIVNAFNGVANNYAYINKNGSFIIEFDKPIKITKIEMIQNSSYQSYWTIYGSNNGVDYITVGSGQRTGSQNITFNTNADYYKFYKFTSNLASSSYSALNITIKEYNYSITTYKINSLLTITEIHL